MIIEITKPDSFSYGVWSIEINLDLEESKLVENENFVFDMLPLPQRQFRIELPFFVVPTAKAESEGWLKGRFENGQ